MVIAVILPDTWHFHLIKSSRVIAILEKFFLYIINILEITEFPVSGKQKKTVHDLDELLPSEYDVVQISLPGQYAIKEAKIREAEGEAEAIRSVQRALADSIKMLNEASPSERVIALKSLEAFEKAADGKATKIIIPSEIQSVAGLATSLKELLTAPQAVPEEVPAPEKPFGCVKDDRPQYPDN